MKNSIIIIIALIFTVNFQAFAQTPSTFNTAFSSEAIMSEGNVDKGLTPQASNEKTIADANGNMEKVLTPTTDISKYARLAKPMAENYTGYKIQLLGSKEELDANHAIYAQFGKIFLDKPAGQVYDFYYLIGDFNNVESANKFMRQMIVHRFPAAKVIRYTNGQRH